MAALDGYDFHLWGGGYGASNDPAWIGARFLKTLDDLSKIDPIYSNWLLTDSVKLKQVRLADVRDNIAALVSNNVSRGDEGDGEPEPDEGYYMCAFNAPKGGPRTVSFSVTAAARTIQKFDLHFGDYRWGVDPALVNTSLFKASLLAILANWPCDWAAAFGYKMELSQKPAGPYIRLDTKSVRRETWLAYLAKDRSADLGATTGLTVEPAPDGGLILIAGPDHPDVEDAAQVQRANLLTAIMKGRSDPPR